MREFKIMQWCSTLNDFRNRYPESGEIGVCSSKDCNSCRNFEKQFNQIFKEEVDKLILKLYEKDDFL